jgi:NADH dehydrogenase [ubiquinone] 1 alpha subcomplex assembly factor 7
MAEVTPLETEIRRRIAAAGPMPVGEYMALCLTDRTQGYYVTRDPLGARGDFITAPEVSQMFGELIGLWMAAVWKQMNEPANLRVIELGPGRGTMMSDALRATKVIPAFRAAVVLHLVEISPALQKQQERNFKQLPVPMFWHPTFMDVPTGPSIIVANEFFDALPVNQAVKTERGWHERCIGTDPEGKLAFTVATDPIPHFERVLAPAVREAAAESIFEWRSDTLAMEMGRRIARDGGGALVIDYGHAKSAVGETLQAVGQHAYADPLTAPGTIDLTAHVDFQTLAQAVEAMGVQSFGPIEQSEFLRKLGIENRVETLRARAKTEGASGSEVDAALARLIGRGGGAMGALFKVAAYAHPSVGVPPGFES